MNQLKIQDHHRNRMACIYLRQSTLGQVRQHQESTQRQYALKDKALAMGWQTDQIRVLDRDLGQSGTQMNQREDFKLLVAEVSLKHVGAVFALEASRLSRSCTDWHRLLELCALTQTLLIDEDGCYDPADFNDQLLLGLKGTMSQAELHFIRARLQGGKLHKAQKGELAFPLPVGFVYDEQNRIVMDPDQEVQAAIGRVFDGFKQTGSAYGVVKLFDQSQWRFPKRSYGGVWNGKLLWGLLSHERVCNILRNPAYTGAYVFGRYRSVKSIDPSGQIKTRCQCMPQDQWQVFLPDHHPAYLAWEEYLANQERLEANQTNGLENCLSGPAREGLTLLQGLIVCPICAHRASIRYKGNGGIYPTYECNAQRKLALSTRSCFSIQAGLVDNAIVKQVWTHLQPEQLEIALRAVSLLEQRQKVHDQQWRLRLERLDYEVCLAQRRYEAVDPANRLVVSTLEKQWNEALLRLEQTRQEYQQAQGQALTLTAEQQDNIRALAKDLPQLWQASTTSAQDRKRILRLLIKDVTIEKNIALRQAVLHVRWQGGACEDLIVRLPQNAPDAMRYPPQLVSQVRMMAQTQQDNDIVSSLNQQGLRSAKGKLFTRDMIRWIRYKHHIPAPELKRPDELTVSEVMEKLAASSHMVYYWIDRGYLPARQIQHNRPYWITLNQQKETELKEWVANSKKVAARNSKSQTNIEIGAI